MKCSVIGLGFGDEGKGLFVDYLASKYSNKSIVSRFSGGHQAGHMVNAGNEKRHVFANIGSGAIRGLPTFWSSNCTVEPVGLMKEIKNLEEIEIVPKLIIDSQSPITTPFDKIANIHWENDKKHGTVGVGFGKTIEREENFYSLKVLDLFFPTVFEEKLANIQEYYGFDEVNLSEFYSACKEFLKHPSIETSLEGVDFLNNYKNIIYEGSQGLLLDPEIGFFPYVTRSNLLPPRGLNDYYFVTRAYSTRHGNGFLANENLDNSFIERNPYEANINHGMQGKFRRSMLDVELIKYSYQRYLQSGRGKGGRDHLVITCLDHLKEYKFSYYGKVYKFSKKEEFCKKIGEFLNIKSIYMVDGDSKDHVYKFDQKK